MLRTAMQSRVARPAVIVLAALMGVAVSYWAVGRGAHFSGSGGGWSGTLHETEDAIVPSMLSGVSYGPETPRAQFSLRRETSFSFFGVHRRAATMSVDRKLPVQRGEPGDFSFAQDLRIPDDALDERWAQPATRAWDGGGAAVWTEISWIDLSVILPVTVLFTSLSVALGLAAVAHVRTDLH